MNEIKYKKRPGRPALPEDEKMVKRLFSITKNQRDLLAKHTNASLIVRDALVKAGYPEKEPTP